jgi:two-component system, NtrC family, sensor kinase
MRRRSRAGGVSLKARRRKPGTLKGRNASKAGHRRSSTPASEQVEMQQLARELAEAREQLAATSEIFQLISSPQTSVHAVLETVATNAVRVCEALHATIYLRDGEVAVTRAQSGPLEGTPVGARRVLNNKSPTGRAVLEGRTIHVPDLQNADDYPEGKEIALRLGHRATLAVPLMCNETAIGAIGLRRREAHSFTHRQISLVQSFAA